MADREGFQPDPVLGRLVVEVEDLRVRLQADLHEAPLEAVPALGTRTAPAGVVGRVVEGVGGRFERIAAEAVQEVHQQQLLVLLLVLQTEFHQSCGNLIQCGHQGLTDPLAPGQHLGDRGPAQEAPLRPGVPFADSLVIAVEEVAPAAVRAGVALPLAQQELLKKPGGVGQMPLRWTGVRHPLQAEVLGL